MLLRRLAIAAAIIGMAGSISACTAQMEEDRSAGDIPPGQVIGEAQSCIQVSRIQSTRVHSDDTIDFNMGGGTFYRNILPSRCYSLGFEERFSYRTNTGQLCDIDSITVLHADGSPGTTCGLGKFLPIELSRD